METTNQVGKYKRYTTRLMKLYGKCHVEDCDQPKRAGNRYLCHFHYFRAEQQLADISKGDGLYGGNINMEKVLAKIEMPPAIQLSAKDYTQKELEYYLKHGELPPQVV